MTEVVIILGSKSDRDIVERSMMMRILKKIGITCEMSVISAHRNPSELAAYCEEKQKQGTKVFIGIAGMAAALPGAIAAHTGARLPVIGVGLVAADGAVAGLDALLSITRMPPGVPVAFAGLNEAGLGNAALLAAQIVAQSRAAVKRELHAYLDQSKKVPEFAISS